MKKFIFITALMTLTSSAFAVHYCTIKGTSSNVGIFEGDSSRAASIYVEGHGYFKITHVDYSNDIYVSEKKGLSPVVLDFKNRTLELDGQTLNLVKCKQTYSE